MPAATAKAPRTRPTATRSGLARAQTVRVGYVPLTDAAPLIGAEELGYFEKAGVNVLLTRELGWGSIREKLVYGELDAAHAPGGLLFSLLSGTHARPCEVATDLILNLQGNAITLSRRLWQKGVRDANSLRLMIRSEMPRKPVFAVVSPFSSHHSLLRAWLRSADINPDTDVRIAILPPPLVGEHMREGLIDGFCVGEPWNSVSALAGEGWIAATSASLAPLHPEKILLASTALLATDEYRLFRRAVVQAAHWCDAAANRNALVDLLKECTFPKLSRDALANALVGPFHNGMEPQPLSEPLHCFYRHEANAATRQRATWFLEGALETGALQISPSQIQDGLNAFQDHSAA